MTQKSSEKIRVGYLRRHIRRFKEPLVTDTTSEGKGTRYLRRETNTSWLLKIHQILLGTESQSTDYIPHFQELLPGQSTRALQNSSEEWIRTLIDLVLAEPAVPWTMT